MVVIAGVEKLAGESIQPFIVCTDHNNLSYLKNTKRLNPQQVPQALFLARFKFFLTYHPGSMQCRAASLVLLVFPASLQPDLILPPSCIVGVVLWQVEERVLKAQQPTLRGGPLNQLLIPGYTRSVSFRLKVFFKSELATREAKQRYSHTHDNKTKGVTQ